MRATMREVLRIAKENKFAIPAANFLDWDSAKSYVMMSEQLGLPLILAFAQVHSCWISLEEAAEIGKYWQKHAKTPIVLHLDHGQDKEFIQKAIHLGFNSVMIDASLEDFEENIRRTKDVVALAHPVEVDVEAEIGFVGSNGNGELQEELKSIYTTVDEAVQFVQATGVDTLAVSIGTSHGLYKGTPKLNFERLSELSRAVPIPLVLHGGSGSGDSNLQRCATHGISKINIFSDFMNAAYHAAKELNGEDYQHYRQSIQLAMQEVLKHYYQVFTTQPIIGGDFCE